MSGRINYTAKVPARNEREMAIPHITKGMSDPGEAHDAASGYAASLVNCTYKGQQLMLGRGGIESICYSASIPSTFEDIRKFIYDDANGLYYILAQTGFYSLSAEGSEDSIDAADPQSSIFSDIIMFNGDVIYIKDGDLYRYDGSATYLVGSISNQIISGVDESEYSDVAFTSSPSYEIVTDTGGLFARPIKRVTAMLKRTAATGGEVTATITVDPSGTPVTYDSYPVNVDVGMTTDYSAVEFTFGDSIIVPVSTRVDLSFTVDVGGATTYIRHHTTYGYSANVNGSIAPTGTGLAVYNHRLYVFDEDNSGPVYYSNYNDPDDYDSTSSDGLVTYGGYFYLDENVDSTVKAVVSFKSKLAISGFSGGKAITELLDENHSAITSTADAVSAKENLISTVNSLLFIHPKGDMSRFALYSWSGNEVDLTMSPDLSVNLNKTIGAQQTGNDSIVAGVDGGADILMLSHGSATDFFVLHLQSGQWTKFSFTLKSVVSGTDSIATLAYINGRLMIGTTKGWIYEYLHGTLTTDETSVDYEIETKKLRMSRFHRTQLKRFLWDIESDGFSGTVTIQSEMGNFDETHSITGDPPLAVNSRAEDTGISFKLDNVTIDELTSVGEIACILATDGRSNT